MREGRVKEKERGRQTDRPKKPTPHLFLPTERVKLNRSGKKSELRNSTREKKTDRVRGTKEYIKTKIYTEVGKKRV